MDEFRVNALMQALEHQRNEALTTNARLMADVAGLTARVEALQGELAALKALKKRARAQSPAT